MEEIDCGGGTVLPGLHDAHIHLFATAARRNAVDCSGMRTIEEIQTAIRERPGGGWVRAVGYDEHLLGRHPTRWDLDAAAFHRPVRLQHRSYHACVLNSRALDLSGIGVETEEPAGGVIERDLATGEPTGLLFEAAQELIRRAIPPASLYQDVAAVSQQLLEWGVTAIQDATASNTLDDVGVFEGLRERKLLRQRATLMLGKLAPGHILKIVLDESTGRLHPSLGELRAQVLRAHRAGNQVALHVVTPAALDAALDAIEYAQCEYKRPDPRHRVEHCSVCTPEQARRIAGLGVVVSTQPGFIRYSGDRYLSDVASDELLCLYPLRTLLDAGVRLAGGSDSPIAPADPWTAMDAAANRVSASGQALHPEQEIRPAEALDMYTAGAAVACFREHELGRVMPGYLADLIVVSGDPPRPVLTMVGGEALWDSRH